MLNHNTKDLLTKTKAIDQKQFALQLQNIINQLLNRQYKEETLAKKN